MNIEARANEIMKSIKSASKETYHKQEVLPELLALQQELVALTFNDTQADLGKLKIWDVENRLAQMNDECDGAATEELKKFESGSKSLCSIIRAQCSCNRGEAMVFYALDNLRTEHLVLKNVELSDGDRRTEIDAVVITCKGAFIIEVKNTRKNIFIDENGDYYRLGEHMKRESNIGEKLHTRHELLRKALCKAGLENIEISEIVVFTNKFIEVHNRCDRIKTCFLRPLNYLIDQWSSDGSLTPWAMHQVAKAIEDARCGEGYPLDLDTTQFKKDFASVMAKLEAAAQHKPEMISEPNTHEAPKLFGFIDFVKTKVFAKPVMVSEVQ